MPNSSGRRPSKQGLRAPVAVSASCHLGLLALSVGWGVLNPTISLGSRDAGGSGGIVAVSAVPVSVARADEPNPVANPTDHNVPAPTEFRRSTELEEPEPEPDEASVPVPDRPARKAPEQAERSVGQRSAGEAASNQLRSSRGAELSSELYRPAPGGAMGFSGERDGPFGTRFGWYAQILQRAIGQQWRRELGKVAGGSSKPVVTSFVIQRTGRIEQVTISESSGNRSLDYSAVRAIRGASPVPPLPPALGKRTVVIEMHFRLV